MNNSANNSEQKARFLLGFLFLGLCAIGAWFAHNVWKNQSLVLLFGTFAGVILICLLFVLIVSTIIWLSIRPIGDPLELRALCGEQKALDYLMPRFLAFIANPSVSWCPIKKVGNSIISQIEIEIENGREMVTFQRRCHIEFTKSPDFSLKRKVFVSDPLGMFLVPVISTVSISEILVEPAEFDGASPNRIRSIANTAGAKASASGAPQGDMVEMRDFQEGDSARLILWKVLAKTDGQRKMVRTEERVESQRAALFLFASGLEDERAASFVRHFFRQKQLAGEWVFGVSGNETIFCRGSGSAPLVKTIRAISQSGNKESNLDDLMADFKNFQRETRRLRIENPIAIIGGNKDADSTGRLCERIRQEAPRCGILVVPLGKEPPFFWKLKL